MSYGIYLVLSLLGFGFALLASALTSLNFNRFKNVATKHNINPLEAAKTFIDGEQLHIGLEFTDQELADHYDPIRNIVRINSGLANQPSLSQVIVTAHEFGHVLQDKSGNILMRARNIVAKYVGFSTNIGYLLIIVGLAFSILDLAVIGLIFFSATTIFMIITLPIEFDASRRGLALLKKYNILDSSEFGAAQSLLGSAALTYVASFLQSLIQLLYFISLVQGRRRRE